jgi:chemotaxis signal transduction protein
MAIDTGTQVVVVSHGGRAIGLIVSELHGVAKFDRSHIIPTPLAPSGNGMLVKQVIKANEASLLVQVVDTAYLFGMLKNPEAA